MSAGACLPWWASCWLLTGATPQHLAAPAAKLPQPLHAPPACNRRAIIQAAYQKAQELRRELDAQWAAYKEQSAAWRAQREVWGRAGGTASAGGLVHPNGLP